jgi:hypothetical protein
MERTIISWNAPNMVTVPLMAAIGFIVFAVLYQVGMRIYTAQTGGSTSGQSGY